MKCGSKRRLAQADSYMYSSRMVITAIPLSPTEMMHQTPPDILPKQQQQQQQCSQDVVPATTPIDGQKPSCCRHSYQLPIQRRKRQRPRPQHAYATTFSSSSSSLWWTAGLVLAACFYIPNLPTTLAQLGTTDRSECIMFLALSDTDRDQQIGRDNGEYLSFINRMSDYAYSSLAVFDELPEPLTTSFQYWAGPDGFMPIPGSYPGRPSLPSEQERLQEICFDVISILHELETASPTMAPTTSAPTSLFPPPPPEPIRIARTFSDCRTSMAISDLSRNAYLDDVEYLRFLNLLTNNQYHGMTYTDLPDLLRFNFVILSDLDVPVRGQRSINIQGSAPGDNLDALPPAQVDALDRICSQTQSAINTVNLFAVSGIPAGAVDATDFDVGGGAGGGVVTNGGANVLNFPKDTLPPLAPIGIGGFIPPAPTPIEISMAPSFAATATATTIPETVEYPKCRLAISVSDRSRDNQIQEEEYVELVYRLSDNEKYRFESFANLPTTLRDTYTALAAQGQTIGAIGVMGAAPGQSASETERAFLEQVCATTLQALRDIPTLPPVVAPTPSPT